MCTCSHRKAVVLRRVSTPHGFSWLFKICTYVGLVFIIIFTFVLTFWRRSARNKRCGRFAGTLHQLPRAKWPTDAGWPGSRSGRKCQCAPARRLQRLRGTSDDVRSGFEPIVCWSELERLKGTAFTHWVTKRIAVGDFPKIQNGTRLQDEYNRFMIIIICFTKMTTRHDTTLGLFLPFRLYAKSKCKIRQLLYEFLPRQFTVVIYFSIYFTCPNISNRFCSGHSIIRFSSTTFNIIFNQGWTFIDW